MQIKSAHPNKLQVFGLHFQTENNYKLQVQMSGEYVYYVLCQSTRETFEIKLTHCKITEELSPSLIPESQYLYVKEGIQ